VIRGWDEGTMKMSKGETSKLQITSGYGENMFRFILQKLDVIHE
jgi:FKBP-type peptidyl-prolyl cis-trans isomerase